METRTESLITDMIVAQIEGFKNEIERLKEENKYLKYQNNKLLNKLLAEKE